MNVFLGKSSYLFVNIPNAMYDSLRFSKVRVDEQLTMRKKVKEAEILQG
jgi:hypothetical protein